MVLKLYQFEVSPAVRAVRSVAQLLNLELELHDVNFATEDHLKPEYLKLNPTHTVPVLDDDGLTIWDSHAIILYLISKYAKNDSLYPKDLEKRSFVDRYLFFEAGTLFARVFSAVKPLWTLTAKSIPQDKLDFIQEAYEFLDKFTEGKQWLVGNRVTIADISMATTLSCSVCVLPLDPEKHANVISWYNNMKTQDWWGTLNEQAVETYKGYLKMMME